MSWGEFDGYGAEMYEPNGTDPVLVTRGEAERIVMPDKLQAFWTTLLQDGTTYLGAVVPRYRRRARTLWLRRYEETEIVWHRIKREGP